MHLDRGNFSAVFQLDEPIVADAGATLLSDELAWVEPSKRLVHTKAGSAIDYDVLVKTWTDPSKKK